MMSPNSVFQIKCPALFRNCDFTWTSTCTDKEFDEKQFNATEVHVTVWLSQKYVLAIDSCAHLYIQHQPGETLNHCKALLCLLSVRDDYVYTIPHSCPLQTSMPYSRAQTLSTSPIDAYLHPVFVDIWFLKTCKLAMCLLKLVSNSMELVNIERRNAFLFMLMMS